MNRPVSVSSDRIEKLLVRCAGAYSQNTLRGYRNDLLQFQKWCAANENEWFPAEPATIAAYVDDEVETKAIATIKHRLDALRFAHVMADLPCPTDHSEVRLAVRRARRKKSVRQKQALGLTSDILGKMLDACPDTLLGRRDAALLCVGYDTLCRSSELALLTVEHVSSCRSSVLVPRSKSDPHGEGRIAYLSKETTAHLEHWLAQAKIEEGPLFCGLHTGKISERALTTPSIRRIVKRAGVRAGLNDVEVKSLSGHSMRIGAAQDMMVVGIDTLGIMQAGGWKSKNVLARYVENAASSRLHQRRWQRLLEMSKSRLPMPHSC
ncbi:tyrosine-type recombinase/integrase [Qipengyuania sp. NPDC077410]|uniref:tyrosine-type recombinase/integrase n=1 Tax=Qipengyuania sp. NPDC077410 TaxID=3364496 RepID=UPI0037C81DDE